VAVLSALRSQEGLLWDASSLSTAMKCGARIGQTPQAFAQRAYRAGPQGESQLCDE